MNTIFTKYISKMISTGEITVDYFYMEPAVFQGKGLQQKALQSSAIGAMPSHDDIAPMAQGL